jgi:hypothetical protein
MHRLVRGMLALGILGAPVTARSEEKATAPMRQQLGEHLFIARQLVPDPFTASSLSSSTALEYGTANGPTFDLDGNPVNVQDYNIGFFSQTLGAQWGLIDWWALRVRLEGTIFGGLNAAGLAGVGVSGVVRAGVGTTFGFRVAENLQLGLLVDVSFGPSLAVNVLQSIRDSLSSGSVQTPVTSSYGTAVTPVASLAWTISRGFGAIVDISYINGVLSANNNSTVDADVVGLQGALEMDLRELGSIPLGIAASYSAGYSTGAGRFRRYLFDLGFYYTGKPGLTAGVDLAYRRAPVEQVFVTSISVIFTLAYTFN